jgi:tetratricopeptide (TPR) repeat protein
MIHCQSCTTQNSMARQFCWKCGTKLLLASGSAPAETPMNLMDEHVLERVSALEYTISIMNKRLDSLAETIERVGANNFIDHTMIETLTDSLESAGINLSNLEVEWRKRITSRLTENEAVDRLGSRMERIIEFYRGSQRKQFMLWIERAYEHIASERTSESLGSLQAAFEHDPANYELGMLMAEVFFQTRDFTASHACLSRVLDSKPNHFEATLLMGLIEKRHGNSNEAQRLLEVAVQLRDNSPSAHATLASLLIENGNRKQAMNHLNRALELKPSAPTHFMMGAIYYQDGRQKRAISHLKQATQLDPEFGEAFYQLGLLCLEMKWERKAQECFKHAQQLNPRENRYRNKAQRYFKGNVTPDQLSGLVLDELHLTTCWSNKSSE